MWVKIRKILKTIVALAALMCSGAVFSQSSVLSDGQWWQLKVESAGIYRVGISEIPALSGVPIASIGMYGGGGGQLSTSNSLTTTSDLRPIAIDVVDVAADGLFNGGDYILFFGEGADVWRYDEGDARWELRRHSYASANYYYLTTSARSPRRVPLVGVASADTVLDWYTAVTAVNNDLYNIFHTGQIWVGERFSTAVPSRSVTLSLPAQATDVRLRYALAYKGSLPGVFEISTTGFSTEHRMSGNLMYDEWLEALSGQRQSVTFAITFRAGESTAEGYLDYVEMSGRVPLRFTGGQVVARYSDGRGLEYVVGGGAPRVWEVTTAGAEREMTVDGGRWTDTLGGPRQYVLFDVAACPAPADVKPLANQDLHGSGQADYVIVCNEMFRQQAQRLASLHEVVDGVTTVVVSDREVYNEFSSGKQDPMAIRSFLRHLRQTHPEAPPRWLLLFGKATYDNRDLMGLRLPTVVTFETTASFDPEGGSYCSDDMLGYLEEHEYGSPSQSLDVGVGRLPAKNVGEAVHMVDKIEGYLTRRDLANGDGGDWRNYVALLADDADPSRSGDTSFVHSSEVTANRIKALFPAINIDRLYADAYRQQSGAIGSYYPDLNNALRQRMNYGCLLLNYVGHGSQKYIGTERYIEPSDLSAYTNVDRLPLMVTSTCSYGWHDIPDDLSGAEMSLLADGAAIGIISAARPISHNERFNTDLVLYALDHSNTIGDALRMARNRTAVPLCIGLSGDPALRLSVPQNRVVVTHIDNHEVREGVADTAKVLSQVTVSGEVRDADDNLIPDFDGTVFPIVFDRETEASTLANDNPGSEVRFFQQKSVLYKGSEVVSGGRFTYTFTVPRDVQYQYDYGKLSHYAVSGTDDATGSYGNILFGGLNEDVVISELRPDIRLFIGDTNFRNGGLASDTPTLIAMLADSVGINAFGSGLGHDITATLDGIPGTLVVLNDFYQPDHVNPRGGELRYTFSNLTPGLHTLTVKAWNIWGYSSTATVDFCVRPSDDPGISSLSVFPNPATEYAVFHCEASEPEAVKSALLQIYSSQGVLVQSFIPVAIGTSQVLGPVRWNLSSVAPGFYMARLIVTLDSGVTRQSTTKLIVR